MNLDTEILVFTMFFALSSLAFSLVCYRNQRNQRELLDIAQKQIEEFHENLIRNKEHLEMNSQRVAEQSSRIAWLEKRVRQPKPANKESADEAFSEPEKLNMTERRHRIITLAARGQNSEEISSTLGMLPGEVELIINLNQVAQVAK